MRVLAVLVLDLAVVVLEVIGAFITAGAHGTGVFQFFTEDSNFFTLGVCAVEAICLIRFLHTGYAIPRWSYVLKYIATCSLTMTFLVVFAILIPWANSAGLDGTGMLLFKGAQPFMHLICPAIVFISFMFLQKGGPLSRRTIWLGATPVYLYGVIAIVLNTGRVMSGPYPFLLVYQQPVWASMLWAVALFALGTGIAAGVWTLGRRKAKHAGKQL